MILPISHEQMSVRRLPWVTFGIMGLCLGAFLVAEVQGPETVRQRWGLIPKQFHLTTDFTHMFLHGGWAHLLGNLFLLFLVGPPLEDRWGRPLFAGFYALAGLASGAFYAAMTPASNLPLVGASGAIAALMGACLLRFARTGIRFSYFLWAMRVFNGTFWAPAWTMLPLWLASSLAMAALHHATGFSTGVAYWAHVGGFAFGVGVAFGVGRARIEERFIDAASEGRVSVASNPLIDEAMTARENGDHTGALARLAEGLRARPDDPDLMAAFWELSIACGSAEQAAPALLRFVKRQLAEDGDPALAARYWGELASRVPDARAEPRTLLQLAPVLLQAGRKADAATALRHAVDERQERVAPGLALRVSDLARQVDTGIAIRAAKRALEAEGVDESKREKIRALVAELEERRRAEPAKAGADPDAPKDLPIDADLPAPFVAAAAAPTAPAAPGAEATAPGGEPVAEAATAPSEIDAEGGPVTAAADAALDSEASEPLPDADLDACDLGPRFSSTKVVDAVLVALSDTGIELERSGGHRGRLAPEAVEAVAVAAVRGLAPKPVLLIDLVLNWTSLGEEVLRIVRVRSDRFDPLSLAPGESGPLAAYRAVLATLLERSGATPLPDAAAATGQPFRTFDDLSSYQREVLQVDA